MQHLPLQSTNPFEMWKHFTHGVLALCGLEGGENFLGKFCWQILLLSPLVSHQKGNESATTGAKSRLVLNALHEATTQEHQGSYQEADPWQPCILHQLLDFQPKPNWWCRVWWQYHAFVGFLLLKHGIKEICMVLLLLHWSLQWRHSKRTRHNVQ